MQGKKYRNNLQSLIDRLQCLVLTFDPLLNANADLLTSYVNVSMNEEINIHLEERKKILKRKEYYEKMLDNLIKELGIQNEL